MDRCAHDDRRSRDGSRSATAATAQPANTISTTTDGRLNLAD
jgi:hypothetical protein